MAIHSPVGTYQYNTATIEDVGVMHDGEPQEIDIQAIIKNAPVVLNQVPTREYFNMAGLTETKPEKLTPETNKPTQHLNDTITGGPTFG